MMIPWMSNAAIEKYSSLVGDGIYVLELGAGHSTVWLAQKGCKVESYEHDKHWFKFVNDHLTSDQVNVHFVENYESEICKYPPNTFDIVVVDGINRIECMEEVLKHKVVKPGGWVLFDDSERRFLKEDWAYACNLYGGWNCVHIGDFPANDIEEYKSYEGTVSPHRLKQTLFAQRPEEVI